MKRTKTEDPQIIQYPNGAYYYRSGNKEVSLKTDDFKTAVQNKRVLLSQGDIFLRSKLNLTVNKIYPLYYADRKAELEAGDIRARTFEKLEYLMGKWVEKEGRFSEGHLLKFFGSKRIAKITSDDWDQCVKKTKLGDYTNLRVVFSHFTKWCARKGYRSTLLILEIPKPKRRPRRILKPHEMAIILQHSTGYLKLFITLGLTLGLRRKEIMTLSWKHLSLEDKWLLLHEEYVKTKKARKIPMPQSVANILTDLKATQAGKSPWVFPHALRPKKDHMTVSGLKTSWHTCKRRAFNTAQGEKLEDITWHDFRATCETFAHKRAEFSSTKFEKFFGANIDVQRSTYVTLDAEDLRGIEDVMSLPQLTIDSGEKTGKGDAQ